jgi:catechol 2,3-dioxygenase-like lactoylglutathione lyase family enzyme
MLPFSRLKHICFAVEDIEVAEFSWAKLLGLKSTGITALSLEGRKGIVRNTFFHLEKGSIELVYQDLPPSWKNSPIDRGSGFHHIAFETKHFDEALEVLAKMGIRPLPRFPIETPHGRVAFFRPEQTAGILIELGETEKGLGPTG